MKIVDLEERSRAIDPTQSFIVQAPAGSGKTELLTQRLLGLLAVAERYPEEVLAITFTKKAAAEMKQRIVQSLQAANTLPQPDEEPAATNWRLAKSVLIRDEKEGWGILDNPHRLRIQTIDGLSSSISRQMPITAGLGAAPQIKDDCYDEYHEAAKATLQAAYHSMGWTPAVDVLLSHMDNDLNRLEELLASLLVKREQWLPHIIPHSADTTALRDHLEQALTIIVEDLLQQAAEYLEEQGGEVMAEIVALSQFAANQLIQQSKVSSITHCADLDEYISAEASELNCWLGIVELLTAKDKTRTKKWRKATARGVTAKIGFPAGKEFQLMKNRMVALLEELNEQHLPLLSLLENIALLPPPVYGDGQWQVVEALLQVLPIAVAQLNMVFQRQGLVDYSEVSQSALHALGACDDPSELALKLDYQIRHVLVDEFQDTSVSQFGLLEKLTAGWQAGDGRTLFIVGDPMQSIYRFREADVSLFLRARQFGIGDTPLESLVLQSNFRSNQSVVGWVNAIFQNAFPTNENLSTGAVTYSPSIAARSEEAIEEAVHYDVTLDSGLQVEQLVAYVEKQRLAAPDESIALLVRAKTHVMPIAELFRARGIPYHAVEIESLGQAPFILDLLSLTKAMLHLGDRIAWLSLLRGPFCGIDLSDLLVASDTQLGMTVWDSLNCLVSDEGAPEPSLSHDGQQRVQRLVTILSHAFSHRGRGYLRDWIESIWIAFGGLAFVDEAQLDDVEQFLVLIENAEEGGTIADLALLERKMASLFAGVQPMENNPVQIMTIHKSKGLEFDTVVLPAMEKKGRGDDPALMAWCRQDIANEDWLLLSPIKQAGGEDEPIYQYIRHLESEKAKWELVRLFYVAATRAKKRLGLFTTVKFDDVKQEFKAAASGSLHKFVEEPVLELAQPLVNASVKALSNDRADQEQQLSLLENGTGDPNDDQRDKGSEGHRSGRRLALGVKFGALYDVNSYLKQKRNVGQFSGNKAEATQMIGQRREINKEVQTSVNESVGMEQETLRLLGTFVHQLFEQHMLRRHRLMQSSELRLSQPQDNFNHTSQESVFSLTEKTQWRWLAQMKNMGMTSQQAELALPVAIKAIENWAGNGELNRLIAQASHSRGALYCEYELSSLSRGELSRGELSKERGLKGLVRKAILDCLFVDDNGNQWVLDYKVIVDESKIKEAIKTYRPQLEDYAQLVSSQQGRARQESQKDRSITCVLYFPVTDYWHEWKYTSISSEKV
ncbi:MAG: UvrD-helicase domain-containing protein [Pseudomonadales bacterium]|nr:UvrD-helicase domain-containing protein [Pseudomonadales bacterium]